jgi:dCTP deaminase
MYLSDIDIKQAVQDQTLIIEPFEPNNVGPTSVDLHLDTIDQAQIWNLEAFEQHNKAHGINGRELAIGRINYGQISSSYLVTPPTQRDSPNALVFKRDGCVILRPGGFLLWQTKEKIGTPENNPKYMCFIDGKSTRARTGLVVHLTAPTIHAGWSGQVTLEIANVGNLDIVLHENDVVAQIVIAEIKNPPENKMAENSVTYQQTQVTGLNN